ncbi:MAG: asparagine synthase (glutamine-hydrolyzing) [Phycisphaera sp.]|nr:asparagine synthase (glutamine-hydrolyzing) [Phycisphaera sp.]
MCGIAGIVRFDDQPIDLGRAVAMRDQLRHRGPDGQGQSVHDRCVFVHTRLSIIDLFSGNQPMHVPQHGESGELTLIFNGEVYNHRALRKQLEALGHRFMSDHCDTEVLLHGYRQWGTELPKHLHGMFAFAIWDNLERSLFLSRDRAGKKPLYYSQRQGELVFGSTAATVVSGLGPGCEVKVRPSALWQYLNLGFTFENSLLEGVVEVPAAHWVRFDSHGKNKTERYWRTPPISRTSTSLGAAEATREVLSEAVAKRLEADVPLGCFLSGGIDSSLIAAIAQKKLTQSGKGPLHTFSVAMNDLHYDESPYARMVAQHIGSRHTELVAQPHPNVIDDLKTLIHHSGEPTADSSILPTYWLSKTTREHVKAVLSGDGGDELFGGYDRYRAMRTLERHAWWMRAMPKTLLPSASDRSVRARLRRLLHAAEAEGSADRYLRMVHLFDSEGLRQLAPDLHAHFADQVILEDWLGDEAPEQAAMRWDLEHYLRYDLLRKIDRASMAVSLEVRCPMLDTQVLDLAGHLPTSVLMPDGRGKGLLRQVAVDWLPSKIVHRQKKGFALPIGAWLRGVLREPLGNYLLSGGLETYGLTKSFIEKCYNEHMSEQRSHTHRLFGLLTLSIWHNWIISINHKRQK